MAATPQNVEMEAAKFLHKLIQESTDEPTKLATKLHVILQHMRSSGKENSMPYQVISRAMETVINRHGLDIDALMSSRQPLTSGPQAGDSSLSQTAGPSQQIPVENDSKKPLTAEDTAKIAAFSSKPLHGPSGAGHDIYQGSANQLSSIKMHGSNAGFSESAEPGNPRSMQFSSSYDNQNAATLMHKGPVGKLDHEVGFPNASKTLQGGSVGEMGMLRNEGSRDTGKSPAPSVGVGPFKEHHLKQLRAQCLVFLAFRNNLMPKKLHLEIALGNVFPKEDISSKEHIDQKGKEQSTGPGSSSSGFVSETNILKGDKIMTEKNDPHPEHSMMIPRKFETDVQTFEAKEPLMSATKQLDPTNMSGLFAVPDNQGNRHVPSVTQRESWKSQSGMEGDRQIVGPKHVNVLEKDAIIGSNQEGESTSPSVTAKVTTCEKWIADCQKRKVADDSNWAVKKKKTEQKISASVEKLKETVSSSEDISAKTKSVIELKKLELLNLQRRLRNEILSDFFRPTSNEMDRLKSIKKHRIGRRSKQLERHEQKMKEERQKRIRERQKDFFGEMEQHRERLEDVFKFRRERLKGFNKYAREFHKRKERLHREKIDRIQREKINLLKINDVEGYLRMVQDAKSDRVKQLLKETEKYLQKLGSKLKEAKVVSRCFESDMTGVNDSSEFTIENEDETDQAKHYMESNEKYYLMAHSIKETVAEQPASLIGGKLREYQMNGLRWLLSLYNNHLNGILADEMGLGKTVQVISLLCYLMENKNDRGPFLVVVPSSVLPGWESEISFWAPSIIKIVYSGPPEERRKLFKERIVQQKFNVLLTTYEYLMNKHDRPKLSKIHWHYVIIDEGHRIKNASCKLNAELKHYHSSHRLLLTGTPLQNNLEELWALLNFLLPNIFNSSEDFSQWFNKPFESNSDNSLEEALLSEEENLLIINRLHQVLRPFVLRRLKHKVENELPGKIERLVRCEASAYQKLLMQRVEDSRGAFGATKARAVHNTVVELRNICNHPYISQLHSEQVHDFIPKHYLPNIIRFCGKLEMLDRLLPKLKATDHRILLFSTMTRLLDVMEDYLYLKQYRYLRLDGHTSGGDRGALIDQFNAPGSPFFIFLLSIRAGGVGVNLQAADTVIIFDTDWNPQVDLQAQARAHRIGQKKEVLVLRLETVKTVEEQVRASAEHKLGVANQSITAGFFDNNTSAEDRREYLEALLRECKKEEAAPVLNDDALNDLMARSESEIDVFEEIDKKRNEEELAIWKKVVSEQGGELVIPPLPSRLVTENELNSFCEAMKAIEVPRPVVVPGIGGKRRGELGSLDMQHYGRGKRAREVRSYEEQWTEDEFEKLCQAENPDSPNRKEEQEPKELDLPIVATESGPVVSPEVTVLPNIQPANDLTVQQTKDVNVNSNPSSKRGRGRPKKKSTEMSPSPIGLPVSPVPITSTVNPVQIPPDSQMSITSPGSKSNPNPSENVQSAVPNVTLAPPPGFQQQPASHPPGFQPISSPPGFQQITHPPPGFQPKITPPTPVSAPSTSQSTLTAPQSTTTTPPPPLPPSQLKSTAAAPVTVPILSPTSPDSLSAVSPTTTPVRGRGRGRGRGRARGRGRGRGQIVESEIDVQQQQQRGRKSHNVVLAIPGLRASSPAGKQVTDSLVVPSTINESLVSTSPAINVVSNTNTPALATVDTPVTVTPKSDIASPTTPVPATVVDSLSTEVGSMSSQTAVTPVVTPAITPIVMPAVTPAVVPAVSAPIGSPLPSNPGIKQGRGRGRKTVTSGSETPRRRRRKQDDSEEPNSNEPAEKKTRVSSGRKSVATRSMLRNQASVTDDNSKSSEPLVESCSNVAEVDAPKVVEPKDNTVATELGLKTVESKPKEEELSVLEVKENEASKEVEKSLAGESSLPQKAEPLKAKNEVIVEKKTETEKTADTPLETEAISSNEKVEGKLELEEEEKVANNSNMTSSLPQGEGDDIATIEGSNLVEKDAKSSDDETGKNIFEDDKTPEDSSAVVQGGKKNEPEPLTEDEKQAAECSASEDNKTEVVVPENELPVENKVEQGKLEPEELEKVVTDPVKEDSNTEPTEGSNVVEKDDAEDERTPDVQKVEKKDSDNVAYTEAKLSDTENSEPTIPTVTTEGSNLVDKDERTPDVQKVEKKESDDVACTEAISSETGKDEETKQQKVGDVNAEKAIDDVDEHIRQGEGVEMNKSESLLETDVKPCEKVESELGSSEINKGENEDDKSPEKIDDAAVVGSNDKDVTEDEESNKQLLLPQGGNADDENTMMEIDYKSPEKTLTEDDQSIKQVPAAQDEIEVSGNIDNPTVVETESKEDYDCVIEAEQKTDIIPPAEGEEKSSEMINKESETCDEVVNSVDEQPLPNETAKEVSVTDSAAVLPNEEEEEEISTDVEKLVDKNEKLVGENEKLETTKEVSVTDSAAAAPNEEEISTDVEKLVDENEKLVGKNEKLETTEEVSVTESAAAVPNEEEEMSTDVKKLVDENEKLVGENDKLETTKEVSVTDSAAAVPNEEEMSTDVEKLVDENEKLVGENEKLETTKEVSVTDSAPVPNEEEEMLTDVEKLVDENEKLVGENEKLETTKEVSVTDSAAAVPNEEEEMSTDVEKLVDENEKLEISADKDEIMEIRESDEKMTKECVDDVTEEKVVAPETDKKEAGDHDDSTVQEIAAETLIKSMDDAKISVEETETEPSTTIIDDPTAVDPSNSIIDDDSTVQEIAAETLTESMDDAKISVEERETEPSTTVIDDPMAVDPSKTITDDPTAVDPSQTIIGDDSTVQEIAAETLIEPSESVDEETETEPSKTVTDDPMAVDPSKTMNNDSTILQEQIVDDDVEQGASKTVEEDDDSTETLIEPPESVDVAKTSAEERETEPSKTVTDDPTAVDPSITLNNDSTILQEQIVDDDDVEQDDSTVQKKAAETLTESVDDAKTSVEERETEPCTTITDDSDQQVAAGVDPLNNDSSITDDSEQQIAADVDPLKNDPTITQEQVAADVDPLKNDSTMIQQVVGKEKEVVPETSMNETESVPTEVDDSAPKEQDIDA